MTDQTPPADLEVTRQGVNDGLIYARDYWKHGNEPESQRALTTLARALEDANVTIRTYAGVPDPTRPRPLQVSDVTLGSEHVHVYEDRWYPLDRRTVRRACVLPGCDHVETKEAIA